MKFTKTLGVMAATVLPSMVCADTPTSAGENMTISMDVWVPNGLPTNLTWPFNCTDIVHSIISSDTFHPPSSDMDPCSSCRITCAAWSWFPPAWAICMVICEVNVCKGGN